MTRCKQVFSVLALVAPFAVAAVLASPVASSDAQADGSLPVLCESTHGVCVTVPMEEALVLRTDVCWDGDQTTLMGAGGCVNGRGYHLTYGFVVDPIANTVVPQSPAVDTCVAGYCVVGEIDLGALLDEGPACCNPKTNECEAPDEHGVCSFGEITWCENLEANGDGTVTCHE
jgi:hypothetical protein